jgi:hypothetical protein
MGYAPIGAGRALASLSGRQDWSMKNRVEIQTEP